jgi:hypothetical protein
VVAIETALLAGADGIALRPEAFLGGEDANHHCTGCSRGRAARSTMCSGLSPTVSYCHILRNLGVGMELTGETDFALANRIFAASSGLCQRSPEGGGAASRKTGLARQILAVWGKYSCPKAPILV